MSVVNRWGLYLSSQAAKLSCWFLPLKSPPRRQRFVRREPVLVYKFFSSKGTEIYTPETEKGEILIDQSGAAAQRGRSVRDVRICLSMDTHEIAPHFCMLSACAHVCKHTQVWTCAFICQHASVFVCACHTDLHEDRARYPLALTISFDIVHSLGIISEKETPQRGRCIYLVLVN